MDHASLGPILIVEDDGKTAALVGLYLEREGFKTIVADNGRQALDLARQLRYPAGETVIDRVIDVHIGKLRQKIEDDPSKPRRILSVRGMGYRFAEDEG